jgi:type II secretion system protein I
MNSERGFTLVETLMAFAILAVVLVTLYEAMGTGLKGFERAAANEAALLAVQSQLDTLAAMPALPHEALSGTIEGTPFRWQAMHLPDPAADAEHLRSSPLRLQRLRLIVSWVEGGAERSLAVEKTFLVTRGSGS